MDEQEIHVDGYRIKRTLGKGGMATVYLAVEEGFDREVALKVMAPQLVADSTFAERFLREARIVGHLAHPHIVTVHRVGVSNGNYFLAMELHTGGDLASKIAGGIDHLRAIGILHQIAEALNYAHARGYVHRDIKPGNVLFSHHGHVVLTDFGIAKAADSSTDLTQVKRVMGESEMTKEGSIVGTPSYMSPEQARGQAVDGRSDIYSLGIMLFEMLTRRVPYQSSDPFAVAIMHINEPIPQLPPEHAIFQPVLEKLLAKDPNDRFQTGAELIEALDVLARQIDTPAPAPEELRTMIVRPGDVPQSARPPGRRGVKVAGVAAGVACAAAAGLYFALAPSPSGPGGESSTSATDAETAGPSGSQAGPGATASDASAPVDPQKVLEQRQIARLLDEAKEAVQQNHLSSPPGDNALEKYQEIFQIDPGNRDAREGQVQVADRYLELAKDAVRDHRVASARRYVDKVAEFAPAHPELPAVRQLVADAEHSAAGRGGSEIRRLGLLGQARLALQEGHLTTPPGDSAYDKYRAVLKLDPNDQQALDGIQKVASRYLDLARAEVGRKNFDKAAEYLSQAQRIAPHHPDLAKAQAYAHDARLAAGG